MSHSSRFLKAHYGAGYRVVCERAAGSDDTSLAAFDDLLKETIPEGRRVPTMAKRKVAEPTFEATLPLDALPEFGAFFRSLDGKLDEVKVSSYGLKVTTLEEVFLAVGADETVAPKELDADALQIGGGRKYQASLPVQVVGLAKKRIDAAPNDAKMLALIFLPAVGCFAGLICRDRRGEVSSTRATPRGDAQRRPPAGAKFNVMSKNNKPQDQASVAIMAFSNLFVPCLLAEQIVRERELKLRDARPGVVAAPAPVEASAQVLAVSGCDWRAYWLGSFLGDAAVLSTIVVM